MELLFFHDLADYAFLRNTLYAVLLASIACGIVGGYIVARRESYMIGAVSHSLLGGVGLARYLQVAQGVVWLSPILGGMLSAVIVAIGITFFTQKTRARVDVVLSGVWSLGVALGVTFISMTPGYAEDLQSYLFGNILLISNGDLLAMGIMDCFIILFGYMFHNRFMAFCFRPEALELRGVSSAKTALLLNILIALTVVLLAQLVGIVLVLVLLVLPAALASCLFQKMPGIMMGGGFFCALFSLMGLVLSYQYDLPAGASIVECTVVVSLVILAVHWMAKKFCR